MIYINMYKYINLPPASSGLAPPTFNLTRPSLSTKLKQTLPSHKMVSVRSLVLQLYIMYTYIILYNSWIYIYFIFKYRKTPIIYPVPTPGTSYYIQKVPYHIRISTIFNNTHIIREKSSIFCQQNILLALLNFLKLFFLLNLMWDTHAPHNHTTLHLSSGLSSPYPSAPSIILSN